MKKYVVNVGNIGNIEYGSRTEANKTYTEYVRQSKGYRVASRAYREDVFLLVDGEPEKEFYHDEWMIDKLQAIVNRKQREVYRAQEILVEFKLEIGAIV